MSDGRLEGKVAIITGASTGLGPVMAATFVREGARVLLAARREELVREAAAAAGAGAIAMRADVTNEGDVEAMVTRAIDEFGHVDIMCNNAAAPGTDLWIWEQTLENWYATIDIDVTAAMLCTREVLKQSMLERQAGRDLEFFVDGCVQRDGSQVSLRDSEGIPEGVHEGRRARGRAPTGSAATAWCPGASTQSCGGIGWRAWPMSTRSTSASERARLLQAVALRDISSTQDVANLVLFLASDDARTITGQSIPVDAGGYMQG